MEQIPREDGKQRRVVLLLGIPGVGKTSLLQEAYNLVKRSEKEVVMVTYSDVMLERAKNERPALHRDELRKLPAQLQFKLQKEAADEISSMGESKLVIVDTHALIRLDTGSFLPGVPSWVGEKLRPTQVIHIEASPEEIANRRTRDKTDRRRDYEGIKEIETHLNLSRIASLIIAAQTGAYLRIINNREGELANTARKLSEAILA